ncbi:hypothetical protein PGQ11_002078 [Apiospora arundinis]|uniref:Zn(2)-C6 fungal-type domain-containing protein n=1 Tax=Apiospora arundinis TaxID=335852 RepID=A0ABR2JID4_9PEZI
MADMSRNCSTTSLVGFSVYQPALGAPLQFVPEMGSKELDDMISAYVPGPASILDKRTAVSLEFFDYTIHTGELFKFFYVYSPVSSSASPASSGMHDSGYGSNFNTSPIMSESQWTQTMPSASASPANVRKSSKKTASSVSKPQTTTDFSHLPGFSIMTKDGQDVTNSVSRGCKTKEQRDHAHLMRIIKACESCRKKKTRCDPSHRKAAKALGASESNGRGSKAKKATATKSANVASMKAEPVVAPSSFASSATGSFALDQSFASASDPVTDGWDQFIQYDEEYAETIPQDYDFFYDPAGYLSPSVSNTSSQVPSPLQPTTPPSVATPGQLFVPADAPTFLQPVSRERMDRVDVNANATDSGLPQVQPLDSRAVLVHRDIASSDAYGTDLGHKPMLPYLAGDAADVGNNYVDFNLYSPASSFLDEDPGQLQDIAVSSGARYHSSQRFYSSQWLDQSRAGTLSDQLLATDSGHHVGDSTLTSHEGDRLVGNATAASSRRSGTTTAHSGFATSSSSTADILSFQESDRLTGNASVTNNAAIANNAAAGNNVAAMSSRIASVDDDGDGDANRVELRRRPGSLTSQKLSTLAVQNSLGDQKSLVDSMTGLQACQDSHAESGTASDQSRARLQCSQISQASSDTASDQSLAALAICAAIVVVSSILSSYVKTSLQWLDGGVQQDACNKTHVALPLALAAVALSSMQTVSQKALGSKQDLHARNHSRWGTRLSGAVSSWKGMGSSLPSSLAGHLQRGILV